MKKKGKEIWLFQQAQFFSLVTKATLKVRTQVRLFLIRFKNPTHPRIPGEESKIGSTQG